MPPLTSSEALGFSLTMLSNGDEFVSSVLACR